MDGHTAGFMETARRLRTSRKKQKKDFVVQLELNFSRPKRGDSRGDGLCFWQFSENGSQVWISVDELNLRREHIRKRDAAWRDKNPALVSDRNRKYRNPINCAARSREWRNNNKERCLELKRQWRIKNPEAMKAQANKYWATHPECRIENRNRRRAAEGKCSIKDTKMIKAIYVMARRVSSCTGIKFDVDHIIPISRGGAHAPSNMQILPARINRRKSNKIIPQPNGTYQLNQAKKIDGRFYCASDFRQV